MKILVLIAGIADPKWPLPPRLDATALVAHTRQYAALSPFDEAVLEVALKLRDADPSVRIAAVVAADDALARQVANFRLDAVHRLETRDPAPWSPRSFASALAAALRSADLDAGLVLVGREFGDLDDGSVPPLVARALGLPCVSQVLAVTAESDGLWITRQRGPAMEQQRLAGPAVLAVTNDSRNRLRHPLLKNVMAARRLQFAPLAAAGDGAKTISLTGFDASVAPARGETCRMIAGSPAEQAAALADVLAGYANATP